MKASSWRFERGMFVALLAVALIPTTLVVSVGTWVLQDTLQRTGSAGPWEAVAASAEELAEEIGAAWPADQPVPTTVSASVARHQENLEASAEMSRLFAAVSTRALDRLPFLVAARPP